MSTPGSIANFAVDVDGKEVPIRYKAEDLINVKAPEGYIWQKRSEYEDERSKFIADYYNGYYDERMAEYEIGEKYYTENSVGMRIFHYYIGRKPIDPETDWPSFARYTGISEKGVGIYYVAKRISE